MVGCSLLRVSAGGIGGYCFGRGGLCLRVGSSLSHAIALALRGDHGGVFGEAIEECSGELLVATEDPRPFREGEIGGDEDATSSVSSGEHVEEELASLAIKRDEADFVDDHQVDALEATHRPPELLGIASLDERTDEVRSSREGDSAT